jgi:hypothetical protein
VARDAVKKKQKRIIIDFSRRPCAAWGDIFAAHQSLLRVGSKSTLPLHLLHELSLMNAYARECGGPTAHWEEGIYAAAIQQGYE